MRRIIVDENIYLDTISLEDANRLQEIANEEIFHQNVGDRFPYPYTLEDAKGFIDHSHNELEKEFGEHNFGIYIQDTYAGNLGYQIKHQGREIHNCHLGYWLGKEYWGNGYMTEIVTKVIVHIFETLDVHRIYAKVISSNPGSRKVLEKAGFELEGVLKKAVRFQDEWYDEWILGLVRKN